MKRKAKLVAIQVVHIVVLMMFQIFNKLTVNKYRINAFHLKIVAIVAMAINHAGYIFSDRFNPLWWEATYLTVGKITFPVMAFLLVEGYKYTRDKWKYLLRILLYALLAIYPFHFALRSNQDLYLFNNVLFTLAVGLLMLMAIDKWGKLKYLFVVAVSIITLFSDWGISGTLIIYLMSLKNKKEIWALFSLLFPIVYFFQTNRWLDLTYLGLLFTVPLFYLYNGTKGYSGKWMKHGFYLFYPLHLLVIKLISLII